VPEAERVRRVCDGLALIRAVWTSERVNLEIGSSRLVDFTLFPRPIQQPRS
jgi:alkanesulfonate monooxygenase SsuD/methylene tetrahydromethanopterin reductase-like flavin-dependent oxidoreductase (luciferase family)